MFCALACWLTVGCGHPAPVRPAVVKDELFARRQASDQRLVVDRDALFERMIARAKTEHDDFAAGKTKARPTIDILVISGGGDWGSFGAGVLKGWRGVNGELALPQFDAVTGVSTGALIAPFAFLGDEASSNLVVDLYRNPKPDWSVSRGLFFFAPSNPSFETIKGLEREINRVTNPQMLARIASEGRTGRALLVNTTNLDDGGRRAWDVTAEAERLPGDAGVKRLRQILLASAAIPGAFPPREIDGRLYVDGGITGNILYGGDTGHSGSLPARWAKQYPGLPVPPIRYWIIFNNQLRFPPQITQQRWPQVIGRAMVMSTQSATVNAIRHLTTMAELDRLKHGANVQVRLMNVPDDWMPPVQGVFKPETMNALADLGEKMGADPGSWKSDLGADPGD